MLSSIADSDSIVYCDRYYHSVVCPFARLSACMTVTLTHPAKTGGRNEMPFDRDTHVVQSNTVLDRGSGLHGMGRFGESEVRNPQLAAMPPIAKLLWPMFLFFCRYHCMMDKDFQ